MRHTASVRQKVRPAQRKQHRILSLPFSPRKAQSSQDSGHQTPDGQFSESRHRKARRKPNNDLSFWTLDRRTDIQGNSVTVSPTTGNRSPLLTTPSSPPFKQISQDRHQHGAQLFEKQPRPLSCWLFFFGCSGNIVDIHAFCTLGKNEGGKETEEHRNCKQADKRSEPPAGRMQAAQ